MVTIDGYLTCYRTLLQDVLYIMVTGRSIVEFTEMIKCATGSDVKLYTNYGCWCHWRHGGNGKPLDELDR